MESLGQIFLFYLTEACLTLVWCSGLWNSFTFFIKRKYTRPIFFQTHSMALAHFLRRTFVRRHFQWPLTHCTPPTHLYYTQDVLVHGPGANKRVEMWGHVFLHSVLQLSGPAINMCMCIYVCVCVVLWERERESERERERERRERERERERRERRERGEREEREREERERERRERRERERERESERVCVCKCELGNWKVCFCPCHFRTGL